jgi:transcriptional regulator NrdR family protein
VKCPVCKSSKVAVLNSRNFKPHLTYRRRECQDCFTRFTTEETIRYDLLDPFIQKKIEEEKNSGNHSKH